MKKRLLIIPIFILFLLPLIIAPSSSYYDYLENHQHLTYDNHLESSKTFLIVEDDGKSYYRTFSSYNKEDKKYNYFKTDYERKGIYRDLYDYHPKNKDTVSYGNFEIKKTVSCPEGWTCEKE